ncbi:MAG TPA: hypothetical protein DDZ76_01340 [Xanthomonadales bacterium]|nr:hypothetical protein [Xanthomonadales bacterium]
MALNAVLGYFQRHVVAANVLALLAVSLGLFFAPQIKNTLTPDIHFPAIELNLSWPGAGAEAVMSQLVEPLEQRLLQMPEVKSVVAHAERGQGSLLVSLADEAAVDRMERFAVASAEEIRRHAPGSEPAVATRMRFEERAFRVGLNGPSREALYEEAMQLRGRFLRQGVPLVEIEGWTTPDLEIAIPAARLNALGVSLEAIARQIRPQLDVSVAGNVRRESDDLVVSSRGTRLDERALADLEIVDASGVAMRLGVLAEIGWRSEDARLARVNGRDGLVLSLMRSIEVDTIEVSRRAREALAEHVRRNPASTATVIEDVAITVLANRSMLIENALFGLLLVFVCMWLVLGARAAFWAAAGIPIVLALTALAMLFTGQSVNLFTVAAFIMVMGVIVDDSIILSEEAASLARTAGLGEDTSLAAAQRMFAPIMAAGLTTVAAFAPLLWLPGFYGAMIAPIAMVVVAAILASLFECFAILPAHLRGSGSAAAEPFDRPHLRRIGDRWLRRLSVAKVVPAMRASLRHRRRTVLTAVAAFVLSLLAMVALFEGEGPAVDNDTLRAFVFLEPGTPADERERIADTFEASLRQAAEGLAAFDDIVSAWTLVERDSSGNPWFEVVVALTPSTERTITSAELLEAWGRHVQPNSWVRRFGMEVDRDKPTTAISWRLAIGSDIEQARAAVEELRGRLLALEEVIRVEDDFSSGARAVEFTLTAQGRALGLDERSLAEQLRAGLEGAQVGRVAHIGGEAEVFVRLPQGEREREDRIEQFPIVLPEGGSVPLWSVARLDERAGAARLGRMDGQPQIQVTAHLAPAFMAQRAAIKRTVDREILPGIKSRYDFKTSRSPLEQEQHALLTALAGAFFVGVIAIYFVLVWNLRSFWWPLLIVATIPLGISGAVFAHLLLGIAPTVMSLFGIIGMAGVVVNDTIVYLARYRELRGRLGYRSAALRAGRDRFRAIALTTLTTVIGAMPLLIDGSPNAYVFKPVLVSFCGGILAGSLLLLLVFPSALTLLEEYRDRLRARFVPVLGGG